MNSILEASAVWSTFRDQNHDLFIQNTTVAGYLTGPVATAGYLTAGPAHQSTAAASAPPPIDHDDS